jgi:two-component system cell cycle response regulator
MFDSIARQLIVAEGRRRGLRTPLLRTGHAIGEWVRSAVAGSVLDAGIGRLVQVTVSTGVSEFERDGNTLDTILRVADERLCRAKDAGRNCVISM